ncbi:MAG TPA: hypothetical protein VL201_00840 [Patescibacteria group bacterium]|jgi:hypothetical protein|nr:hypothetical protein [Patescibacteria group bacterium]
MKNNALYFFSLLCSLTTTYGWYFYSPLRDHVLLPSFDDPIKKSFFIIGAGSTSHAHAHTHNGTSDNPFFLWNSSESTIPMLQGFDGASKIGQLAQTINAHDDGTRGHIVLYGKYQITYGLLYGMFMPIAHGWSFLCMMPQYHAKLSNIYMQDLTQQQTAEDSRVKQFLTNPLPSILDMYGSGLSINDWHKTGVGDLTCYMQWKCYFPQQKPMLKNVLLNARVGIELPTAQHISTNNMLSHSFGNEGAWALPVGGQLKLYLGNYFAVGLDAEFTYILNQKVTRRVKTVKEQTELLLLYKTKTHIDFGMNQRFELFAQICMEKYGLNTTLAYQYFKHGDDTLTPCSLAVDAQIINNAQSLYEITAHHVILNTEWNIAKSLNSNWRVNPTMSIFAKIPFNGKNGLLNTFIGSSLAINF